MAFHWLTVFLLELTIRYTAVSILKLTKFFQKNRQPYCLCLLFFFPLILIDKPSTVVLSQ